MSRCALPLLLFFNEDYPQITALINGLLAEFEDELISVLKCPGGTSGISQPNDLMKAHLIFRQACGLGEYWSNYFLKKYKLPLYWTNQLLPYFRVNGVSSASMDTYGYFFSTLMKLIAKSFRIETVQRGERAAKIQSVTLFKLPLNTHLLISKPIFDYYFRLGISWT